MKKICKFKKIKGVITAVIISSIIAFILLAIISIKIKPLLIEIGTYEASKIESTIVNNTVNEMFNNENENIKDLFDIAFSKNNTIQAIDFNSNEVNKILSRLTIKIQNNLKSLDEGTIEDLGIYHQKTLNTKKEFLKKGILIEVPIGIVHGNTLFAELGPKIPLKLHYLGDVNGSINTKIHEYGINNALMEIYANIEVEAKIVLPFMSKNIKLNTSIPIAMKIIQGSVPQYYGSEISKNSSLYSLPFE